MGNSIKNRSGAYNARSHTNVRNDILPFWPAKAAIFSFLGVQPGPEVTAVFHPVWQIRLLSTAFKLLHSPKHGKQKKLTGMRRRETPVAGHQSLRAFWTWSDYGLTSTRRATKIPCNKFALRGLDSAWNGFWIRRIGLAGRRRNIGWSRDRCLPNPGLPRPRLAS